MNSFLLAFTAVLILVLSALFAAPLFIDWNDYRPVFETQASKLLGRDVKVGGKVHMVLLPAPELRFDDVKVADEKGSFEPAPARGALDRGLAQYRRALLRGAIEARKIAITEPVLRLALREDGTGNWSDVGRAGEALPFVPKEVLLDQVSVSGGRVEVSRPGMPPLVVDNVSRRSKRRVAVRSLQGLGDLRLCGAPAGASLLDRRERCRWRVPAQIGAARSRSQHHLSA